MAAGNASTIDIAAAMADLEGAVMDISEVSDEDERVEEGDCSGELVERLTSRPLWGTSTCGGKDRQPYDLDVQGWRLRKQLKP